MADIRINALATTAASTASDDFIAVDGSANGTRKLNAYSPTFGGNLTVGGATTVKGQISSVTNSTIIVDYVTGGDYGRLLSPNSAGNYTTPIQIVNGLTVGGNLTVNGGTASVSSSSGSTDATIRAQLGGAGTTGKGIFSSYITGVIEWQFGGLASDSSFRISSAGLGTSDALTLKSNGNLLIGTTSDGGQKLQVSGSGIFGNTTGASTTTPVNLSLGGTYGTTYANGIKLSVFDGGGTKHGLGVTSGVLYLATSDTATTIQLATNNTTALTLDSSQNATFAGTVKVKNQATLNANAMVNVGTSATSIFSALNTSSANWAFVFGDNGTSGFADLVVTVGNGNAVAVISSATIYGSPPARTYTSSSTNLQLAMASGTMSVRTSSLNNGT